MPRTPWTELRGNAGAPEPITRDGPGIVSDGPAERPEPPEPATVPVMGLSRAVAGRLGPRRRRVGTWSPGVQNRRVVALRHGFLRGIRLASPTWRDTTSWSKENGPEPLTPLGAPRPVPDRQRRRLRRGRAGQPRHHRSARARHRDQREPDGRHAGGARGGPAGRPVSRAERRAPCRLHVGGADDRSLGPPPAPAGAGAPARCVWRADRRPPDPPRLPSPHASRIQRRAALPGGEPRPRHPASRLLPGQVRRRLLRAMGRRAHGSQPDRDRLAGGPPPEVAPGIHGARLPSGRRGMPLRRGLQLAARARGAGAHGPAREGRGRASRDPADQLSRVPDAGRADDDPAQHRPRHLRRRFDLPRPVWHDRRTIPPLCSRRSRCGGSLRSPWRCSSCCPGSRPRSSGFSTTG